LLNNEKSSPIKKELNVNDPNEKVSRNMYAAGIKIRGIVIIRTKYLISFFMFVKELTAARNINKTMFSRIKSTDRDKSSDVSKSCLILRSYLLVCIKILKILQAEKINADEIINLKSTDSRGYDKITRGYKIKWRAFLPDLSIVICLVTVSIE
tara:strand:+ start:63 stop:521 length:459 start_codon:yes stop_codon:yes gene_type:complete